MRLAAIVVLATFLGGCCCSTVDTVGYRPLDASRYGEITRRASSRSATVVLVDGSRLRVRDVRFLGEEVSWRDAVSGQPGGTEARLVREVRFSNRTRGMRNGSFWGGLVGLSLGVASGMVEGDDPDAGDCDILCAGETWEQKSVLNGIGLGFTGFVLGGAAGAASGGEDVYLAPLPFAP